MQTLASVNLQSMNNALAMATADRVAAEAALNAARARGISEGALNNLSINNQRSKRAEVAAELAGMLAKFEPDYPPAKALKRSEEHTSELQSLMRISYAVFCLKKKKKHIM